MASLESLKNPVTRLGVLGTAASQSASFRRNEVNNGDIWDVTKQYYLNDMVFSEIDGGAYVFSGGATVGGAPPQTSILGGVDPATDWFNGSSVWVPSISAGYGYNDVDGAGRATGATDSDSWFVGLQWSDVFAQGNTAGIAVGQPGNSENISEDATMLEIFYKYQVSDNISITPALFYVSNNQRFQNESSWGGVVQTKFTF